MTDGFQVSPDQLSSSAERLGQVADEFNQQVQQFQSQITGYGEPWGGDDIGMLIGLAHTACFEAAMDCFKENAKELEERVKALEAVAKNYTTMEQSNVQAVNSVSKALG
ncbi:PE domain-containing protein [Actinomadura sp. KC06]|uniref:WXG100 family type VII secretion target n=1 Tax=Actinomadura sp. KC06 TaxID=2530369 RepID=UPI001044FBE2|nr:PE domain-containing protein [Actinomadura sp. KC06]TDD25209.1 PE domain-containing protein [Actinomadura sp. KC06]